MGKSISMLCAAAAACLALGAANAADQSAPTNEEKLQQQKDTAQEPSKQQTTGDLTKQEQEYLSALKKCESMNAAEKQQCVDRTRKEFGHK
jgi:hypothetical protein